MGQSTTNLGKIHVFPSEALYNQFKDVIADNDLALLKDDGATVVETYRNGTEWYRVWSDGWVEQGGRVTDASSSGIVTLNKPMKDTNYTIVCQEGDEGAFEATSTDTGGYGNNMGITNGTTTSFRYSVTDGRYFNWYISGMGA